MANCSMAYGTITLEGVWTAKMLKELNIVKAEWASWSYNIDVDNDFSTGLLSQSFSGCGRWTFCHNITNLGQWTRDEAKGKPKLKSAYKALTSEMERHGSYIDLSYTDMESGDQLLCEGVSRLRADRGVLFVDSSSEQKYDYCWKEYLDRDFGGEALLEENINGIFEKISIDESRREPLSAIIAVWITANTLPGYVAESLTETQLAELQVLLRA